MTYKDLDQWVDEYGFDNREDGNGYEIQTAEGR